MEMNPQADFCSCMHYGKAARPTQTHMQNQPLEPHYSALLGPRGTPTGKQALARIASRHTQLVKLCHDLVPTAKVTHQYSLLQPATCIMCTHPVEDFNHMLKCDHANRNPWQHTLYAALCATMENQTIQPYLVDILLDNTHYPLAFQKLIHDKTSLGWRQLFQGRSAVQKFLPHSWIDEDTIMSKAAKHDDAVVHTSMWDQRITLPYPWHCKVGLRTLLFFC
jgi:hypothetical protein